VVRGKGIHFDSIAVVAMDSLPSHRSAILAGNDNREDAMTEPTRRENIVRFIQQAAAVTFAVWMAVIFNRRGELAGMPGAEAFGSALGWLIAAAPFGVILTAIGWGFRIVVKWVLRN